MPCHFGDIHSMFCFLLGFFFLELPSSKEYVGPLQDRVDNGRGESFLGFHYYGGP